MSNATYTSIYDIALHPQAIHFVLLMKTDIIHLLMYFWAMGMEIKIINCRKNNDLNLMKKKKGEERERVYQIHNLQSKSTISVYS